MAVVVLAVIVSVAEVVTSTVVLAGAVSEAV